MKRAVEWLAAGELISVTSMLNGFTRPIISQRGVAVVELGGRAETALLDKGMSVTHVNITNSNGVNVAVDSSDVQQSNTVTVEQREQINKFVESAKVMLPLLGLDQVKQDEALVIVGDLATETADVAPKQSRLKELLGKVVDIAVAGTASGMVNALVSMGETAMASIG